MCGVKIFLWLFCGQIQFLFLLHLLIIAKLMCYACALYCQLSKLNNAKGREDSVKGGRMSPPPTLNETLVNLSKKCTEHGGFNWGSKILFHCFSSQKVVRKEWCVAAGPKVVPPFNSETTHVWNLATNLCGAIPALRSSEASPGRISALVGSLGVVLPEQVCPT